MTLQNLLKVIGGDESVTALAVFGSSSSASWNCQKFERLGAHLDSDEVEVKSLLFVVTRAADFKDGDGK